ncbi:sulfatase [Turneriella parva DSM 21527]|uniref:Sulfatase n=2 Tax=Turneriella TaxID=338321 RepID=I4B160_TURPD|nr:sulfatase [Turneriella parva DSM 21527]
MLVLSHCIFHILFLTTAAPPIAWLVALRFTLATVAPALFLPGLVYILSPSGGRVRKIALWVCGFITYYGLTIVVGDLAYYRQAGKHSTVELLLYYQNFFDVSLMALKDYTYVPLIYLVAGVAFFFGWRVLVRSEKQLPSASGGGRHFRQAAVVAAFAFLSLLFTRGGLQGRPVRPADAFVHLSQAHGDFALNGIYTSFYSMFNRSSFPVISDGESVARARSIIAGDNERFISDALPFLRVQQGSPAIKKNVVFIILESWSAKRLGVFGDKTGATPFFDSLAARGWFFTNAYATGRRSIASLPSAISSIPTLFGSLYITSPFEQNFQRGMGSVFKSAGYSTSFTYAASAGSMGFNAFARLAGFENIVTRESFAADAPHDGVWGVYDHVAFSRVLSDIDAAPKPFVSVMYTLHPHPPFTLPAGNAWYNETIPRAKYYNALRYSDQTLREFFTAAEKKIWFRETVFVLMADHAFDEAQGRDSYHIPLLIYSPGFVTPRRDARVASELDVLPTLVSLLQLPTLHAAMGKSLTAKGERFAFIDIEHAGGFITEKNGALLSVLFDTEGYSGHYNMSQDAAWQNLLQPAPLAAAKLQALKDYLGVMGYAIAKNRIAPANQAETR